jgi:hypothetical protein
MTGNAPVLIVAPWLSARTRELLAERGINYIDQTGNALVSEGRRAGRAAGREDVQDHGLSNRA